MAGFRRIVETVGLVVDGAGVAVIALGLLWATAAFGGRVIARRAGACRAYRHDLGRSILLGLELLVAGDIIRTVGVAPTMQNVLVLGLIVLIRTFLSFSLEVELEGRWPWRARDGRAGA